MFGIHFYVLIGVYLLLPIFTSWLATVVTIQLLAPAYQRARAMRRRRYHLHALVIAAGVGMASATVKTLGATYKLIPVMAVASLSIWAYRKLHPVQPWPDWPTARVVRS